MKPLRDDNQESLNIIGKVPIKEPQLTVKPSIVLWHMLNSHIHDSQKCKKMLQYVDEIHKVLYSFLFDFTKR